MIAAIIVAAGQGRRMGGPVRKQYLALCGRPILAHTLSVFDACPDVDRVVLVVAGEDLEWCRQGLLLDYPVEKPLTLISGGDCRQESVFRGIEALEAEDGIVLIHDGVRPLPPMALLNACIAGARRWGGCIPALAVSDTLKRIDDRQLIQETLPREKLVLAQTPQAFRLQLIRSAHRLARRHGWQATDDASLVERMGGQVKVIPGAPENMKVTTPEDLKWAERICRLDGDDLDNS